MAKIRAYKLAEELGIDRSEIVEKAAAVGVELRNAMTTLDEDVAAELREKLGSAAAAEPEAKRVVTERRVQRGSGAASRTFARHPPTDPPPNACGASRISRSNS